MSARSIHAGTSLPAFAGAYGDYLRGKISKVFPEPGKRVL